MAADLEPFRLPKKGQGNVGDLHRYLTEARGVAVQIDASEARVMTVPYLQMLLCAEQEWQAKGASLHIINQSEDFRQSLSQLGLAADHFASEATA